jgi:F0F1-type ATP synthase membrane subunit b/b'
MTTFATEHDTERQLQELDERTRTAWEDYRSSISELAGEAYEEAELVSWERLQRSLHELADERERLVGAVHGEDALPG